MNPNLAIERGPHLTIVVPMDPWPLSSRMYGGAFTPEERSGASHHTPVTLPFRRYDIKIVILYDDHHRNRWFTVLKNGDFPWRTAK